MSSSLGPCIKGLGLGGGGVPAVPAAIASTGLYFRWNPAFSTLTTTTDAQGRTVVTQMNDMVGSANATSSGTEHPVLMTDNQGRRFLRFNSLSWMSFTTAAAMNYKSIMLQFVGRMHRPSNLNGGITNIVYLNGFAGPHAHLNVAPNATTPFLRIVNAATATATTRERAVAGSQLQLLTIRSRTTAPNIQVRVNKDTVVAPAGTITSAVQGVAGGQIVALNGAGNLGGFDLYEIAGYNVEVDAGGGNATLDANCDAYMAYYNIANSTRSITLEGNSRTFGYGNGPAAADYGNNSVIPSGDCLAVQLAMNSADNDVRIVSVAATGNATLDITTQRDFANSMMSSTGGYVAAWQNDVHYLIGTNDQSAALGTSTPAWTTAAFSTARGDEIMDRTPGVIAYAYTVAGLAGCLQRGLRCYVSTEIARNDTGGMAAIDELRTRVLDPAFLASCFADAGNTYDGQVIVNDLGGWTVAGATVFRTAANANNTTYYNNDKLHLRTEGTRQYALSIRGALGLTPA